jgi:hypothetical protein
MEKNYFSLIFNRVIEKEFLKKYSLVVEVNPTFFKLFFSLFINNLVKQKTNFSFYTFNLLYFILFITGTC